MIFFAVVAVTPQFVIGISDISRMGDRSIPMKFGPEWLRNLAPGTSGSGNNNHNSPMSSNLPLASASAGPSGGNTASANSPNTSNASSKVLLAKQR